MTKKLNIKIEKRPSEMSYEEWDTLSFSEAFEKFLSIFDILIPPIVVGLYGDWGSGKTEMIKGLSERLEVKKYVTHIFDAWKYRKEENIILPFLQDFVSKHHAISPEVKKSAKNIMTAVALTSLNQIINNSIGINLKDVKSELKFAEERQKHYENYRNKISEIENEFNSLIKGVLGEEKILVVFIDNLDRCLPEYVLNLLEDITNFFHSENCIFVLSMDKNVIVKAIKERYKNFNGERYLEKIIQLGLNMPLPGISEDGSSKAIYHFMKRYEQAKGYSGDSTRGGSRDKIYNKLRDTLSLLFSDGFLNNPRRIEKYVNKFLVLQRVNLLDIEEDPENIPFVIMVMIFKEQFYEVYSSITEEKDAKTLNIFLNYSVSTDDTPTKFKERGYGGAHLYNELLLEKYKTDNQFYKFLKLFHQIVTEKGKLSDETGFVNKYFKARQLVSIVD